MKSLKQRFDEKVMPEPMSGCWIWTGCVIKGGYAQIGVGRKATFAHRVSYQLHKGEIPKGLHVCHTCDVRCCVNPDHLFLGTHQDNMDDRQMKGRQSLEPRTKGETVHFSKLKESQVLEIRKMRSLGVSTINIAKKFGVTDSNISSILRRETWKHI